MAWDSFEYRDKKIYINWEVLKNSIWKEYIIDSQMLELYSKSYPIIPKDSYLILWDQITWSIDSSRFWLVSIWDFEWKIK